MDVEFCDLCGRQIVGRRFSRRDYMAKPFCSISCVEAFEMRAGLPSGRIYEKRQGWSDFPAVTISPMQLAS